MKKSQFVALLLGVISGFCFALGMCMSFIAQWNMRTEGILVGCLGLLLAMFTVFVYRRMEKKPRIQLNKKNIGVCLLCVVGVLLFGIGMCMSMLSKQYLFGIGVGFLGILVLLCMIPLYKGIK